MECLMLNLVRATNLRDLRLTFACFLTMNQKMGMLKFVWFAFKNEDKEIKTGKSKNGHCRVPNPNFFYSIFDRLWNGCILRKNKGT